MNRDIAKYVLNLRDRVTRRQHHVLLVLACHHQEARETFWPSRTKLAIELSMDESQLRRIIGELEQAGILKHIPGIGAGNRSSFIFVEFEKGDIKGDIKGDFFDPLIRNYKVFTEPLQDQNQKPSAFDSSEQQNREKGNLVSSSAPQIRDDDTSVSRILAAFEQSPVTTGSAKLSDRETARQLLTTFTVEQIEYGILLAGVRRLTSFLTLDPAGREKSQAKVQTLAYFANAIEEAATDPNLNASYAQYLRHKLRQYRDGFLRKEPQRATG